MGSIFRLLTLLDESQVDEEARDRRGNFTTQALSPARKSVAATPLVEIESERLFETVCRAQPAWRGLRMSRWPGDRKYAFLLSHDTDAITLGAPSEMAYNLAKAVVRGDGTSLRMFVAGFKYLRRADRNPLFGFPLWRRLEGARLRSCFYLFVRPKGVKRDLNDCRSSVDNQLIDWSILSKMADDGWEFGVHAPIHAKGNRAALQTAKKYVESKLARPIAGIRHHYWAIDWRNPHSTFRKQAEAGFRYDASIAWRDVAGFRAATCLPFQPFDFDTNEPVQMYELPTVLMDGHIRAPGKRYQEAAADGLAVIETVKQHGGVACLDWHTESACNEYRYRGDVPILEHIIESVLADSEAWVTTPENLIRHWDDRSRKLSATDLNDCASSSASLESQVSRSVGGGFKSASFEPEALQCAK
ncbi:MAG TPA: hypothetical protein VG498_24615 [Terriglobales bacterium]|nr:hypothetical protein [Terriglobales bacterium]